MWLIKFKLTKVNIVQFLVELAIFQMFIGHLQLMATKLNRCRTFPSMKKIPLGTAALRRWR